MLKFVKRIITMSKSIPGPKAKAILKRGVSLFQNGLIYEDKLEQAARRGFRPAGQVMVDKAYDKYLSEIASEKFTSIEGFVSKLSERLQQAALSNSSLLTFRIFCVWIKDF